MATLIFVHGTGVREGSFVKSLDLVKARASAIGHEAIGVNWGAAFGTKLLCEGASIPDYRSTGGAVGNDPADRAAEQRDELWLVLYADPLFELRLLGQADPQEPFGLGGELPGDLLRAGVARLGDSAELSTFLKVDDRRAQFARAKALVEGSDEFARAMETVCDGGTDHHDAVARAIAAYMEPLDDSGVELSAAARDELVAHVSSDLSAVALGGFTDMLDALRLAMSWRIADPVLARRRGQFTDRASLLAGDILAYTRDGSETRALIAGTVRRATQPVYLLGHSLGGIMCVDLLCMEALPVEGLITVGSQAAFMYEIGGLRGLSHPALLPKSFPTWLNLYDKRDLLAYLAHPVFGDKVRDVLVSNQVSFPTPHGGYWDNPAVWQAIQGFVH